MQTPLKAIDSIRRYNFIEIELQGEIAEEEERFIIPFFPRRRRLNIWDLERIFLNISRSSTIRGVLIKIRDLNIGLARAEEIRRGISELREKEKGFSFILKARGTLST